MTSSTIAAAVRGEDAERRRRAPSRARAAANPRISERRVPSTTCEKMSLPWSVVPKRWFHDGAWRVARMLKSVGLLTEIHGAITATSTMKPMRVEAEARLRILEQERGPARKVQAAALPRRRDAQRGDLGLDDGLQLRHQAFRTRGSRTKLRRSMMKFAPITQNAKTSSSPCVSG